MIQKKVKEVEISDLEQLVATQVREGKTIEYKRVLPLGADGEKKEFLADISSFANTNGGDILFGVVAKDGVATSISPINISNVDAETLRLESIIRSGIDPRFAFTVHPIPTGKSDEYVLLIRVEESWNKPHRIVFGGAGKFFGRSSAGKYELDVDELRQVFTLSDGIEKRMEAFRAERLIAIQTGSTTLPLSSDNIIVVHLLPLRSFSTKSIVPQDVMSDLRTQSGMFKPMQASGWHSPQTNLEGIFSFAGRTGESAHSYVQFFRNGAIELVESSILDRGDSNQIPYQLYEFSVVDGVRRAIEILKKVDIGAPVLICLSLLNVRGMIMSDNRHERFEYDERPIQQKDLVLPAVNHDDYTVDVAKILRASFDLVWNACGVASSQNYDSDGNFKVVG